MPSQTNFAFSKSAPAAALDEVLVQWLQTAGDPNLISAPVKNTGGVDARTGTSEAITLAARGKLVTFNNASAVGASLPNASTLNGVFWLAVKNIGAGLVTITPTTSTIDGAATKTVATGTGLLIFTDGTNYFTLAMGAGSAATWGSITGTLSAQTDLQAALDAKLDDSQLDTDGTLAANSDAKIASQKATKTYVDAAVSGAGAVSSVFGRTGAVVAASADYSEDKISFTDITTNNVSTTKHGYAPKLPNNAAKYLDGSGNYSTPALSSLLSDVFTPVRYTGRTAGTVYQNTTGFPIIVLALLVTNNNGVNKAFADASNPPTSEVARCSGNVSGFGINQNFCFIVQPNHYYKITGANITAITCILEYSLIKGSIADSGDISGSRAYATTYQNTSSYVMWLSIRIGTGGTSTLVSDSSSTPTTQIWTQKISGGTDMTVFIPILPGHYYKLTNNGTGSIAGWNEYTWTGVSATRSGSLTGRANSFSSSQNYYNQSGKSIWVNLSFHTSSTTGTLLGYYTVNGEGRNSTLPSPSFSPTDQVAGCSSTTSDLRNIGFGVPYNEIYNVRSDGGTTNIDNYFEWFFS